MPYKVGVVGYGLSAKIFHIPFINDSAAFEITAILQRHPTDDNSAAKDFPHATVHSSLDELLPTVDLVVITTPPTTHFNLASTIIRAKKHVLVEKPFTPTSKEAYDLTKLAEEHGVILSVYQNRRYDSDFMTLKSLLDSRVFGKVVDFESHFDRHRPDAPTIESWKTDPSAYTAVYDLGTHLIDQIVSLYGFPKRITGFVGSQRGTAIEDSFNGLLHYDWGNATVKASVVSPEKNQLRFWIRGTKGGWRKCHLDAQEDQLKDGLRPGDKGYGEEGEAKWGVLTKADGFVEEKTKPVQGGYTLFYDDLAKALDGGKLVVDGKTAAGVIRLCELMRESSSSGRTLDVQV